MQWRLIVALVLKAKFRFMFEQYTIVNGCVLFTKQTFVNKESYLDRIRTLSEEELRSWALMSA